MVKLCSDSTGSWRRRERVSCAGLRGRFEAFVDEFIACCFRRDFFARDLDAGLDREGSDSSDERDSSLPTKAS